MPFKSENFPRRRAFMMLLRSMILSLALPSISAMAQDAGNGIHVGDAKVYDERELTLMLDSLNQSIQGKNFIDQSKLAAALGNVQGFQNTDTSFSVFANVQSARRLRRSLQTTFQHLALRLLLRR